MKRTAKFVAALNVAPQILEPAQFQLAKKDNDALYSALEEHGWFWDAEAVKWSDFKKSTSIFENDNGLATGDCRLRLMAHPGDIDRLIETVIEALDSYSVRVTETSKQYPNRRGPGVRVYMTVQLGPAKHGSND
jgi:hypothetical protein